jgi:hypothetical protein
LVLFEFGTFILGGLECTATHPSPEWGAINVGNVGVALVATHFGIITHFGFNIVFMPKNGWPQGPPLQDFIHLFPIFL